MSNLMSTYKPAEMIFVRGEGARLFDADNKEYLDFLSGLAVTSLGHAHPAVAKAIGEQATKLLHVSNLFRNELHEEVAATLDELIGDGTRAGGKVFFANSGAEANECAVKLARRFGGRGRHHVVSAYGSFHGRTLATLHATGQPAKHEAFAPLPEGFRHVAFGDIDQLATAADPTVVSGILLEVIQGEGGVVPAPPGYLKDVRALCDERGILLMVDEVQTGLARTGRWFAFQNEGVLPDVVTMAKALGNGMPVSACWAKEEIAAVFQPGDHATTFGGQPMALSAAKATLATMIAIDAPARARHAGAYLEEQLVKVPGVIGVRGRGLLLGVELAENIDAQKVADVSLAMGLIINCPVPGIIRMAPPLIITDKDCDLAVELFGAAIAVVTEGAAS